MTLFFSSNYSEAYISSQVRVLSSLYRPTNNTHETNDDFCFIGNL